VSDKPLRIELVEEEEAERADARTAFTAEKQFDVVSFNAGSEQRFLELVCQLLDAGELTAREAVTEASYELDISPETSKRYLQKHSARRARFDIADGHVRCRAHDHGLRRARRADRGES
jgi:predicted transcriptional regulator YheO